MRHALLSAATLVVAVTWSGAPLRAHAIESTLERLAGARDTLELQSRFSSGVPAADAAVSLVSPSGQTLALGHTDAQGELRFALPASVDATWELRVDRGPGHRDYLELPAGASATRPAAAATHGVGSSLAQLTWGGSASLLLVGALIGARRRPHL